MFLLIQQSGGKCEVILFFFIKIKNKQNKQITASEYKYKISFNKHWKFQPAHLSLSEQSTDRIFFQEFK